MPRKCYHTKQQQVDQIAAVRCCLQVQADLTVKKCDKLSGMAQVNHAEASYVLDGNGMHAI